MGKILNDKVKSITEEILSVKTNQDFNQQKPTLKDPNQAENIPSSQELKKASKAVKASIDSAEKNINDEGKDHSKSVKKDLPKAAFITPYGDNKDNDDSKNLTLIEHKNNYIENKKKEK
jgi:hypothetical protein